MIDSTDRSLVTRTLAGDTDAYGEMVRRYQGAVFNVCYRLIGERRSAEDLAQDTFIRAYQRLDTFDNQRAFGPWIRRVAANLCYNHLKKKQVMEFSLDEEKDISASTTFRSPEGLLDSKEQSEKVRFALMGLPDHYRIVLELRHFQDMSYEEIAAELDLPLNTAKSHLFRARKQLAKILSGNIHD
jgi:RNA polymerase sigma-70 factor (ECF subfamily)